MPKFSYTGKNLNGEPIQGVASAKNASDLELRLVDHGIFVESSRPSLTWLQTTYLKHFKKGEVTTLTRQLHILTKSKVSILESLELAREQVNDDTLQQILLQIIQDVKAGSSLATSFGYFPCSFDELFVSMIEAGELSGDLEFAFDRIADYREKSEDTAKKVKSAMAYPLLVVIVALLVVMALIVYVVPVFSSMYENFNADLPELTRKVVIVSDLLRNNSAYLGLGMIVIIMGAGFTFTTSKAKMLLHRLVLRLPLFGRLTTKVVTARFCRTMGALLTSGVDIIYALRIAARTTGNLYASRLAQSAEEDLVSGKSLTESLEPLGLFPKAMLRLTASGENTGQLGEMLTHSAEYYEREANSDIGTLTTLVEPVIIIVMGVVVAFILIAMYLPLFDLVDVL